MDDIHREGDGGKWSIVTVVICPFVSDALLCLSPMRGAQSRDEQGQSAGRQEGPSEIKEVPSDSDNPGYRTRLAEMLLKSCANVCVYTCTDIFESACVCVHENTRVGQLGCPFG